MAGVGSTGVSVDDDVGSTPLPRPLLQHPGHLVRLGLVVGQVGMAGYEIGLAYLAIQRGRGASALESGEQWCPHPVLMAVTPPACRSSFVPVQINQRCPEDLSELVGECRLADSALGGRDGDDLGHGLILADQVSLVTHPADTACRGRRIGLNTSRYRRRIQPDTT